MPELVEQMYCSQQIVIPPKFPYILKRYCKAAIKTQPYDLLRWSYEYFKALAENRPPPVKLRLEYPVYSTEGGLTRGCLKVLAVQLAGMTDVPIPVVKSAWAGFCLDSHELRRILCLCEVYRRCDSVPFLHFIAVAGGLLTKCLTHTMILLCESLTKEPDGGSAAIPAADFLTMYKYLARMDASADVKYLNGYREGEAPEPEETVEEEKVEEEEDEKQETTSDDFWGEEEGLKLQKLSVINAHVAISNKISQKTIEPILTKIERSPSMERAGQIERENYLRERKGLPARSEDIDKKLREMSSAKFSTLSLEKQDEKVEPKKKEEQIVEKKKEGIEIFVYNEEDCEIPYEFYGEPVVTETDLESDEEASSIKIEEEEDVKVQEIAETEEQRVKSLITELYKAREERLNDLMITFEDIAATVDKFLTANYDLGMVAGRQMSTTSGEFIVQHIEQEIMAYIDEQIAILPDPDLKKKKAKPEEVAMIKEMLENFLDENMEIIVPEIEEVEEEESPLPEVVMVYAVPGIGPIVDDTIIRDFEEYALEVSQVQADLLMPRNVRHFLCPPLEKYEEQNYEQKKSKNTEEVPTGGSITD